MNNFNDYELLMLYHEKNEDAEKILLDEYNIVIKYIIKKYKSSLLSKNCDLDDIYNECLEVLHKALDSFNEYKEASFNTYIKLLLERKIKKIIIKKEIQKDESKDIELYSKNDNPLKLLCDSEKKKDIIRCLLTNLTSNELDVVVLLSQGYSYKEAANLLNEHYYKIYYMIKNIRKKIFAKKLELLNSM